VAVTKRGKPALAILPWELYESIAETLEILEDKDLMAVLRRGIAEVESGKGIPWKKRHCPFGAEHAGGAPRMSDKARHCVS